MINKVRSYIQYSTRSVDYKNELFLGYFLKYPGNTGKHYLKQPINWHFHLRVNIGDKIINDPYPNPND